MSQFLSQVMGQQMRMEQRLTPQLIQSMDILQMSTTALEQRIAEELERNVALELVDDEGPKLGSERQKEKSEAPKDGETDSFNRLDKFSNEYDLDFNERLSYRKSIGDGERDAKIDAMANTADRPEGLDEHLLQQWTLLDIDENISRAGEAIIYHLDEDGYLRISLESIAADSPDPLSVESLEEALTLVQQLEPVGVAARDPKECLLLQLEALPGDNSIERTLIENHLEDMARNRFPAIAKATGFSLGEISAAVEAIRETLVLHPAYLVVEKRVPRVYPDVVIDYDEKGKGFVVKLTRGNVPDLRVKTDCVDQSKDRQNPKEVREFLKKQLENAGGLIEAVRFRRNRLMDVAEAITIHQREFLEHGPAHLQVLRMNDLAESLGCDPSTISRTVADKYVETPHGVFPLRHFFTGGTHADNGHEASWDSIKRRVAQLIESEDPKKPYSDDKVVELLTKEGINISRRTVAKYRAQLDIPAARQRKQF